MSSILTLTDSLYDWDPSLVEERIFFDELHQRVIHQKSGGLHVINVQAGAVKSDSPGEPTIKSDLPGLRLVRFSPDGSYMVLLLEKKMVICMEATQTSSQEPITVSFKWVKQDLEVLNCFWLSAPPSHGDHADLCVITTYGVELFRVNFELRVAKSVKSFPASVRMCWIEPLSGMILCCLGPHTLQPFHIQSKSPQKMPKFDLILERSKQIEAHDVAVMTIYDSTFCIHADGAHGRVSLRNISNPSQGTPEHDIVIDIIEEDAPTGVLRLSKVDNLLVVHRIERMVSTVFDIRHRDKALVPSISSPCHLVQGPKQYTEPVEGWDYAGGSMIIDRVSGHIYRLEINMELVLKELQVRSPQDLATVMRLLLRRSNCREHIVQTLRAVITAKASSQEVAQGFAVLNHAYRQAIEAVSKNSASIHGRSAAVSLNELEIAIGKQSVLSEKDMVSQVFYPQVVAAGAVPKREELEGVQHVEDAWRIPLPPPDNVENSDDKSRPVRSPYIVSIVVAYLRSLLSMQILPHKILQCFVFDICMLFHQEHTLQQLLHYYVLLDSPELVTRLQEVSLRSNRSWATQACLDMALRLQEYHVVADMLLQNGQYLDIVPFLINQQATGFKLCRLLQKIEEDEKARADDPDILDHVLNEVRIWRHEAAVDSGQNQILPPDLEGCERWLPELATAEATAAAVQNSGR